VGELQRWCPPDTRRHSAGRRRRPGWHGDLFFAPLVLVELTTLSLLTMTPMVTLSRTVFSCLALMLLVFAVWALAGFGYPSAPVPFAMNVVSKILAFVTALSLFFPEWFAWWRRGRRDAGADEASGRSRRALGRRAIAG
jgi:hypothetical protein